MSGTKRKDRKKRRIAQRDVTRKTRNVRVTVAAETIDGTVHYIKTPLIGQFVVSHTGRIFQKGETYQNTVKHAISGIRDRIVSARIVNFRGAV
jgi:hypothetical protein